MLPILIFFLFTVSLSIAENPSLPIRKEIYSADSTLKQRHQYNYDEQGRMIQEFFFKDDVEPIWVYKVDYKAEGGKKNAIRVYGKDTPDYPGETGLYTYNSAGQLETVTWFGEREQIFEVDKYSYKDGKISVIKNYTFGKELHSFFTFEYDSSGNIIKKVNNYKNKITYWLNEYSKDRLTKKSNYDDKDDLVSYTIYTYDNKARLKKETMYTKKDKLYKYSSYIYE